MVNLVPAKCPNCGAQLELDDNMKRAECSFCKSTIIVDDAIAKYKVEISGEVKVDGIVGKEELLKNAESKIKVGRYDDGFKDYRDYWDKGRNSSFYNYTSNPSWCTDNYGDIINYYELRCMEYYNDNISRKIFVIAPYSFFVGSDTASFTMCIEFKYNLSNTIVYICVDIEGNNLFNTFN